MEFSGINIAHGIIRRLRRNRKSKTKNATIPEFYGFSLGADQAQCYFPPFFFPSRFFQPPVLSHTLCQLGVNSGPLFWLTRLERRGRNCTNL